MDAFAALYRSHVGAVARAVRDNVHDNESVADVIQDVFFRALERLSTLRSHEAFGPWLLSIARHAAIDHRRSRSTAPVALDDVPEVASPGPGPDDVAEIKELAELVRGCVAGLSPRDAAALTLVGQLGLSPKEVAGCLGVSPGTAKVILHRARLRLRNALALELLVRRRVGGCPELDLLFDGGDIVAAGRHVRSCPQCASLVESELQLYSVRAAG